MAGPGRGRGELAGDLGAAAGHRVVGVVDDDVELPVMHIDAPSGEVGDRPAGIRLGAIVSGARFNGGCRHRASQAERGGGERVMERYEEDGRRYVSLAGLRMRGWTGALVHRLLGPPDRLSVDPRARAAPHLRLYRVERVEAAERGEEFRQGRAPKPHGPGQAP